jgi:hypothetical protein
MWLIPALLVLAVVYLAHASEPTADPSGTPNGVRIDANGKMIADVGPDRALPYLGANGTPSPYTGLGRAGASDQRKALYYLANPPSSRGNGSAFIHPARLGGTGLLDPLPDRGSRSKRLLTQDVPGLPGGKV